MKAQPLVSVIVPVYNAAPFLKETLASVLEQTYANLEIVLIDDGSSDGSYDLAMEYKARNVIVKKNMGKGACAARNYGFKLSSGDYIQYLDADDLLGPNKIEKQVAQLSKLENGHIASCKWGRFFKSTESVKWEDQAINKDYKDPGQWLADSWSGGGMSANSCWLAPRILIEEAGFWNEELQLNQDGEFFCRVLLKSKSIAFIKDCGVYYRSGLPNSISQKNNKSKEKAESLLGSYQLYKRHIGKHYINPSLKMALANNFLMFMYQYHSHFPDLSAVAEKEFYDLGYNKMWPVGGWRFQRMAKIIGFKMALMIRGVVGFPDIQ